MLKQEHEFVDFNDQKQTITLWFNLTKSELTENLDLEKEIKEIQETFQGDRRELTPDEIRKMLYFVKRLIKISYGERSEDGLKFKKNESVWDDFFYSAAYESFLWDLFQDTDRLLAFFVGIFPQDLIAEAKKQLGEDLTGDNRPAYQKENRKPTPVELQNMSQAELAQLMTWQNKQ